jgi:hypothetical protein
VLRFVLLLARGRRPSLATSVRRSLRTPTPTDSVCGTAPCAVGRRQGGTVAPRTPTSEKPEIEGREVRTQRPARRVSQPQRQRQPSHGVSQRRDRDSEQGTRDDLAPRRHASLRAPARPRDRLAVRSRTAMIGISRPLMVLVMLMLMMRARSALSRRVCRLGLALTPRPPLWQSVRALSELSLVSRPLTLCHALCPLVRVSCMTRGDVCGVKHFE